MNTLDSPHQPTNQLSFANRFNFIQDQIPEVKVVVPDTLRPALIPAVKNPVLRYMSDRFIGRGEFQLAEYDLAEIGRCEDTDSYVRQAFNKKTALMFKEGYDIVGKNPRTIKYIRARLAQIARASQNPVTKLLRDVGSSLIRKSNAFLVKVRKIDASGGKVRTNPGNSGLLKPVAGYFIAPAEAMEYKLSNNRIVQWRQKMPSGDIVEWRAEDIIHFYFDRKDGFVFGTPILIPVLDDVRALRKIEENVELLIYQHLFPLFHYKVGTPEAPAGFAETGEREIDIVRREIQYMPTEGGIVTPERHEITAIGSEGRALRAETYLEHFKQRVFAGLGISAIDMGLGDTANRATADNMSRNLVDSVKDMQQVLEIFVNEFIIAELLLESTFGDSVLDEENRCYIKFREIDIDAQIKKENHQADLFEKDTITWDEARIKIGYDPIALPTAEEIDSGVDLAEKYPEWYKTRWKVFDEPKALIQAVDEPFSPGAKAAAANKSTSVTSQQVQEAGDEQMAQEVALEKERTKAKIAVAKAKPKPPIRKKDSFLHETFLEIRQNVVTRVEQSSDLDWIGSLIRTTMQPAIDRLLATQVTAFTQGFTRYYPSQTQEYLQTIGLARSHLRERAEYFVTRLTNSIVASVRRQSATLSALELKQHVRAILDSHEYRFDFIEDVEVRKAKNYGRLSALGLQNTYTGYRSISSNTECAICTEYAQLDHTIRYANLENVVPHHANCKCDIQVFDQTGIVNLKLQDGKIDDPAEFVPQHNYADCPKCTKKALRKKDTPDIYNCRACGHSFRLKDVEDSKKMQSKLGPRSKETQFSECHQKQEAMFRTRHQDWDEDQVIAAAEVACAHMLENAVDSELEDGTLESCVLAVKKSLKKKNPSMSEDKIKSSAFAICQSRKGK